VKPTLWIVATLAAIATTAPAHASLELAQKNACTACHAVDARRVGPTYLDIARRYAGQPGAVEQIAQNIRLGGMGRWGQIPMPAQLGLSDVEARTLAAWIIDGAR